MSKRNWSDLISPVFLGVQCISSEAKGDMSEREGRKVPLVPYSPPQAPAAWSGARGVEDETRR